MPIRLVFAGHYRSGSTAIFEIMRRTLYKWNKNAIVLYEPFHPELPDKLKNWEIGKKDVLHGLNLWDDYFKLKDRELEDLISLHPGKTVYESINEVREYLDYIHSLPYDIYLQPNRSHYFALDMRIRYRCKYLHTYRNPIVTWFDYLPPEVRNNKQLFKRVSLREDYDDYSTHAFYLPDEYEMISKRFDADVASNVLQRFYVVWLYNNYYAYISSDATVYFRSLVLNPLKIAMRINNIVGHKLFDNESLSILDVNKEISNKFLPMFMSGDFDSVIQKLNFEPFNEIRRYLIKERRWDFFQNL